MYRAFIGLLVLLLSGCDGFCIPYGSAGHSFAVVATDSIDDFSVAPDAPVVLEMNRYWGSRVTNTGSGCSEPTDEIRTWPKHQISWAVAASPHLEIRANGSLLSIRALGAASPDTVWVASTNQSGSTGPYDYDILSRPLHLLVSAGQTTTRESDTTFADTEENKMLRVSHTPLSFSPGDTVAVVVETVRRETGAPFEPGAYTSYTWVIADDVQFLNGRSGEDRELDELRYTRSDTLLITPRAPGPIRGMVRQSHGMYGEGLGFYLVSDSTNAASFAAQDRW
jgi:hypothetical protein